MPDVRAGRDRGRSIAQRVLEAFNSGGSCVSFSLQAPRTAGAKGTLVLAGLHTTPSTGTYSARSRERLREAIAALQAAEHYLNGAAPWCESELADARHPAPLKGASAQVLAPDIRLLPRRRTVHFEMPAALVRQLAHFVYNNRGDIAVSTVRWRL